VHDFYETEMMCLTNVIFFEVKMFQTLGHDKCRLVDAGTVVTVNSGTGVGAGHTEITGSKLNVEKLVRHPFVATVSASQEPRAVLFCLVDFQLMGAPE
jgi:hypothetical protein